MLSNAQGVWSAHIYKTMPLERLKKKKKNEANTLHTGVVFFFFLISSSLPLIKQIKYFSVCLLWHNNTFITTDHSCTFEFLSIAQ
jgi:hypothetical protein